jgi:manganese efflux pump family protein
VPAGAAVVHSRALGIATLIAWLFTASIGAYMLSRLIAHDGLRRQRARKDGLSPAVLFGHFSLALTGLAVWVGYLVTGWVTLAWPAVGLLIPGIGLGISTVTLWTPYPDTDTDPAPGASPLTGARGTSFPGGMLAPPSADALADKLTDRVLASAATDEVLMRRLVEEVLAGVRADPSRGARKPRGHLAALIPLSHGLGALVTFLLAVITAASGMIS